MSIPRSGSLTRSCGIIAAIAKNIRILNIKPLSKITVQFDPFHEKVDETRKFLTYVSGPKVVATNPGCLLKTNIVCDRSEPTVTLNFKAGNKLVFKCENLTALNILQLCNKHVSSLVEPEKRELTYRERVAEEKKKRRKTQKIKPFSKHRGVFLLDF